MFNISLYSYGHLIAGPVGRMLYYNSCRKKDWLTGQNAVTLHSGRDQLGMLHLHVTRLRQG